jgi:hypothetical protein
MIVTNIYPFDGNLASLKDLWQASILDAHEAWGRSWIVIAQFKLANRWSQVDWCEGWRSGSGNRRWNGSMRTTIIVIIFTCLRDTADLVIAGVTVNHSPTDTQIITANALFRSDSTHLCASTSATSIHAVFSTVFTAILSTVFSSVLSTVFSSVLAVPIAAAIDSKTAISLQLITSKLRSSLVLAADCAVRIPGASTTTSSNLSRHFISGCGDAVIQDHCQNGNDQKNARFWVHLEVLTIAKILCIAGESFVEC